MPRKDRRYMVGIHLWVPALAPYGETAEQAAVGMVADRLPEAVIVEVDGCELAEDQPPGIEWEDWQPKKP